MSVNSIIDTTTADPVYKDKIFPDLIPFQHPGAQQNLGSVLFTGNSAANPTTGLPQDATDFDLLGCKEISTGKVFQGNNLSVQIGDPTDTIKIKGATDLGSILVGNGVNTEELVCPTTTTTATTSTIYNWNTLSVSQSKTFTTSDGSLYQLGYSITITYSGTDFITGTITAIAGNDITLTITAKGSAAYVNGTLMTTTPPDPAIAGSLTNPVFLLNPATTTPTPPDLPQNSMITGGLCYLYSTNGNPSPTPFTISIVGTNIQRPTSASANTPLYENPPTTPTAYAYADGCFVADTQIPQIQANTSGVPIDFGFPAGGSFAPADFCGTISGYTLAYSSGLIAINSKLVLTADNTKPLGVFWGVDAQGVGTITSVSAGTNISVSGSLSAPVVNFATPTTSNIQLGVGTEILATSGNTTMSIDSTGLNDTYLNGLVENKEDIAVSSTNVVQTISATDGSTYQNSAIVNCGTSTISDQKLATNLTTTQEGSAAITCSPTLANMGVGCGFPSGAAGSVGLQATDTNPLIALSQSAPFATSYSTIFDKDGITQNNSAGSGFTINSNSLNCSITSGAVASLTGGTSGTTSTIACSTGSIIASGDTQVFASGLAGSVATPNFTMRNSNVAPTSYPALKLDKSGVVAPTSGTISAISSWAIDATGTSREWSRIQTKVENVGAGNQDATLSIFNSVNGVVSETFNFNGAQNENNSFRPLDMNGNAIRTTSGSMEINTSASSTAGAVLTLATKDNVAGSGAGLALTGNTLLSGSSSGNSGQHLALTINGVVYKIQLLNN